MAEAASRVYPGTFDPVTNGHLDVIARAARLLDKLVVGVAINTGKGPIFTLEERVELVEAEMRPIAKRAGIVIEVRPFATLLIDFARKVGAQMIVRGLRAVSDFDYEFQMAGMNYRLDPDDRDRVPDGERDAPVHRLAIREGHRHLWRRHHEFRAEADGRKNHSETER